MTPTLPDLVSQYKRAAETGDESDLLVSLDRVPIGIRKEFAIFVKGELARLIKLRTLGLTAGFEEKSAVTDRILARLKEMT